MTNISKRNKKRIYSTISETLTARFSSSDLLHASARMTARMVAPYALATGPEPRVSIPVTMPEPQPAPHDAAEPGETPVNLEDIQQLDPEVKAAMAALGDMFSVETNAEVFLPPRPPGFGVPAPGKPKRDEEPGEGKEDHDPASNDGQDS